MENQTYHIQKLLANELDNCKEKGNNYVEGHIKKRQNTYKQKDKEQDIKEKQQIQDEKVLLYKPYKVDLSRSKTPELTFIQDEIENLKKYMKFI